MKVRVEMRVGSLVFSKLIMTIIMIIVILPNFQRKMKSEAQ